MKSLILVTGHAIPRRLDSPASDEGWFLKHFQVGGARSYIEHLRYGVLLAAGDEDRILLFSAGQTDPEAKARVIGLSRTNRLVWSCLR